MIYAGRDAIAIFQLTDDDYVSAIFLDRPFSDLMSQRNRLLAQERREGRVDSGRTRRLLQPTDRGHLEGLRLGPRNDRRSA